MKKTIAKKVPVAERITDQEEIDAVGVYFACSNAGQIGVAEDRFIGEQAKTKSWGRIYSRMQQILESMASDAGTIDMTGDELMNDLMKEAKDWSKLAKNGDSYVTTEWKKLISQGVRK